MNLDQLTNKLFITYLESTGDAPGADPNYSRMLKRFRAKWHEFVAIRQTLGTCIQCNRKHQPGMQKCGVHRNKNKARCLAWAAAHRDAIRRQYLVRRASGVCVASPRHGAAFEGHVLCRKCYRRNKDKK